MKKETIKIIEEDWKQIQEWLDYLVKVGYVNAKFDIASLLHQEREKAVEEVIQGIRNLGYTEYVASHEPFILHPKAIQLDRIENFFLSLHSTNKTKE